jgi:hypothetical protein
MLLHEVQVYVMIVLNARTKALLSIFAISVDVGSSNLIIIHAVSSKGQRVKFRFGSS